MKEQPVGQSLSDHGSRNLKGNFIVDRGSQATLSRNSDLKCKPYVASSPLERALCWLPAFRLSNVNPKSTIERRSFPNFGKLS